MDGRGRCGRDADHAENQMKFDIKTAAITLAAIVVLSRIDATAGIVGSLTGNGNRYWR